MARTFSSGYASANIAVPTGYPFTMFIRGYTTSNSAPLFFPVFSVSLCLCGSNSARLHAALAAK